MVFAQHWKLKRDVRSMMLDLGAKAEDIAASLAEYGVKVGPQGTGSELLTSYLNAVIGGERGVVSVEVRRNRALVKARRRLRPLVVVMPCELYELVVLFDNGHYPVLRLQNESGNRED